MSCVLPRFLHFRTTTIYTVDEMLRVVLTVKKDCLFCLLSLLYYDHVVGRASFTIIELSDIV